LEVIPRAKEANCWRSSISSAGKNPIKTKIWLKIDGAISPSQQIVLHYLRLEEHVRTGEGKQKIDGDSSPDVKWWN
jgi:hypothetical protein